MRKAPLRHVLPAMSAEEWADYKRDTWFRLLASYPGEYAHPRNTGKPDPAWEGGLDAMTIDTTFSAQFMATIYRAGRFDMLRFT